MKETVSKISSIAYKALVLVALYCLVTLFHQHANIDFPTISSETATTTTKLVAQQPSLPSTGQSKTSMEKEINVGTKSTAGRIALIDNKGSADNVVKPVQFAMNDSRRPNQYGLHPTKYVVSAAVSQLVNPSKYQTFDDFPVCKSEPDLCKRGRKVQKILDEFKARPRPKIRLQQEGAKTRTVRVLMNTPEWWGKHDDWDQFLDPSHCMGISCDARFGHFTNVNTTNLGLKFHKRSTVPTDPDWKPNVYLHRLNPDISTPVLKTLWQNHSIAFALESGESCPSKKGIYGCQYSKSNLYASPATIVTAMTGGDVIFFVLRRKNLKKDLLDWPPPTVDMFAKTPYYSGLFVSNCRAGAQLRTRWLRELMKDIPIASYGNCPKHTKGMNCQPPSCDKVEESRKYPFHIAIENSPMLPNYMTEKVWQAYFSNSLPVVWSAPDIDAYLPPHSFIDVRNFTSPHDLANYMKRVRNDAELYSSYFAWRKDPDIVESFERQLGAVAHGPGAQAVCGVCHAFLQNFVASDIPFRTNDMQ